MFFNIQEHRERNALVSTRREAFWWGNFIDTGAALSFRLSYATEKPGIGIENGGNTPRFLLTPLNF